jgi:hypothetical protein
MLNHFKELNKKNKNIYNHANFNFDNRVPPPGSVQNKQPENYKEDQIYFMQNAGVDGGMILEPRLQEYVKKKKFNKFYNIETCIPLEREYMITRKDLARIRAFIKGEPLKEDRPLTTNISGNNIKGICDRYPTACPFGDEQNSSSNIWTSTGEFKHSKDLKNERSTFKDRLDDLQDKKNKDLKKAKKSRRQLENELIEGFDVESDVLDEMVFKNNKQKSHYGSRMRNKLELTPDIEEHYDDAMGKIDRNVIRNINQRSILNRSKRKVSDNMEVSNTREAFDPSIENKPDHRNDFMLGDNSDEFGFSGYDAQEDNNNTNTVPMLMGEDGFSIPVKTSQLDHVFGPTLDVKKSLEDPITGSFNKSSFVYDAKGSASDKHVDEYKKLNGPQIPDVMYKTNLKDKYNLSNQSGQSNPLKYYGDNTNTDALDWNQNEDDIYSQVGKMPYHGHVGAGQIGVDSHIRFGPNEQVKYGDNTYGSSSDYDTVHKMVIPRVNARNNKEDMTHKAACYQPIPYMSGMGSGIRNIDLETNMFQGEPSHTRKSDGYPNPFENYYQFVNREMNHPDHVVMPFPRGGISTRNMDKVSVKERRIERGVYR